jgi:hypothetical protein
MLVKAAESHSRCARINCQTKTPITIVDTTMNMLRNQASRSTTRPERGETKSKEGEPHSAEGRPGFKVFRRKQDQ